MRPVPQLSGLQGGWKENYFDGALGTDRTLDFGVDGHFDPSPNRHAFNLAADESNIEASMAFDEDDMFDLFN